VSLARGALFNLAGHLAPLAAAVAALPILAGHLDAERFGFLSLAWVIVGYFSLFDMGLGRALSRLVAQMSGTPNANRLPRLTQTALWLTLALGTLSGAALFLFAPQICRVLFQVPGPLQDEAIPALRVLALSLPLVTLTAALRGLLEGGQRFGWVNAIRVPLGVLTFAAPAALVLYTPNLVSLALLLAGLRLVAALAHWAACWKLYPRYMRLTTPSRAEFREMFGVGAWMTVSNVVGPLMVYLDRFVIAGLLSLSAVAYYSGPYEALTRLWVLPAALTGALFPAFVEARERNTERLVWLYRTGLKAVLLGIFPITFLAALFAPEWIAPWLGAEYADQGARAAKILAVGVLVNCLAYLPFTLLQASGRADITGKLHLAEFPLYIALLAALTTVAGIEGAALAWTVRCIVDACALFYFAGHALPRPARVLQPRQHAAIALLLAFMGAALLPAALAAKVLLLAVTMLIFFALGWLVLLSPEERRLARHPLALLAGGSRPL
jgi:O-antigen/teichoic acid export membrane protein